MSAAITQYTRNADPTIGMELTTGDEIALEATRWLWLAGDLLDPHRKDDLPHLAEGGEELQNFCLRRTNGFLPRLTLTPLEVWAEWIPIEYFPEGVRPMKLKGQDVKDENPSGRTLVGKPLFGYPHYPGELIVDAVGLSAGDKRGVVEIEALRGVPVEDAEPDRIQSLFFPADFAPIELRLVEEQVNRVADAGGSDIKSIAKDMLQSCEQFRRWAMREIDKCNSQLDTRVKHDWTYSYYPKIHALMKQLEITPRGSYNVVDSMLATMRAQGITPDVLAQMEARDASLVEKLGQAFSDALGKAFASVQPPAE